MIPLTRKENYLNEIVGWGNTAPEKPTTPEEFFFAAILGEAVQVPDLSNASRYELFLAKIAGYNVNVSPPTYTSPRLEFFLAKAAGMDVVTPVPLTKEEIFWANYKGIEQIIEGVPPLMFKSNGANLSNYRIYGNTVSGESVGDRTGNLFDGNFLQGYWAYADGRFTYTNRWICTNKIPCTGGQAYTYSFSKASRWFGFVWYDGDGDYISTNNRQDESNTQYRLYYAEAPSNAEFMVANIAGYPSDLEKIFPIDVTDFMLVEGQYTIETMPAYEHYGYRVPVTVTNGTDTQTTNLYLPEQIKMVGNEAEYVDYKEQKQHFADGTSTDVLLPTLPTLSGTNTLSFETTVQPSKVMIKTGKFGTHKVRYYDSDGTFLSAEDVKDGTNAQGFTPTKASTAQYNYTFMGWSTTKGSTTAETGVLNDITADKSLYAVFSQSLRTFTVYFYNDSALLQTAENVQYGGTATYTGETPTKDGFTFSGWQPSNVNITADTSCYAQFVEG